LALHGPSKPFAIPAGSFERPRNFIIHNLLRPDFAFHSLVAGTMRTLIATNDHHLATGLRSALHDAGAGSRLIQDPVALLAKASDGACDAIVLDLAWDESPQLLLKLRRNNIAAPVLGIAAGEAASERINALHQGADDCVARKFDIGEVTARLHAMLRRRGREERVTLEFEDLAINRLTRQAQRGGKSLHLSVREFAALEYLMLNPGRTVSPREFCEQVWKLNYQPGTNIVQVTIMRLRRKVDAGFATKLILTSPYEGYYLGSTVGSLLVPRIAQAA
jgi:two-component system, OmpR family, response regulator